MQQRLKPVAGIARAKVVAAELFAQLFFAADDALATLDVGFGRETLSTFTGALEKSNLDRRIDWFAWLFS
jgi:hypothetical protein